MDWLTILVAVAAVAMVMVSLWLTRRRGYIETLGIPIDPPFLIFGSEPHALHKQDTLFYLRKFKEFGSKTYGCYTGPTPTIITIDPELVKSVMIKNFDSFPAAMDVPVTDASSTLDIIWGEKWKNLRKNMSPIFSSGKLKGMMEPIAEEVEKYIDVLEEERKKGNPINIKKTVTGAAMNIILRCAFGLELDAYNNQNQNNQAIAEKITKASDDLLAGFTMKSPVETFFFQFFFVYFPGIMKLIPMWPQAYDDMWKISDGIMKQREISGENRKDFLSRLLDLKKAVIADPNAENHRGITPGIITSQGSIFILAGYVTLIDTMQRVYYALAKNQDVQQKAYEEVMGAMDRFEGKINHESADEMQYLEAVINESMRMWGTGNFVGRICKKDCEIAPGLLVKKDMQVWTPITASHYHEDFFPEPEKFKPERFLKKDFDPITFRPFGAGPRMCIGNRFALTEMKITAAMTLKNFRILDSPATQMNKHPWCYMMLSHDDILVELERRS